MALLLFADGCASEICFFNSDVLKVPANGDTDDAIRIEIASDDFAWALAKKTGLPVWKARNLFHVDDSGMITYSSSLPTNVQKLASEYIAIRNAGHSRNYAMAMTSVVKERQPKNADEQTILYNDKYAYLPWLRFYGSNTVSGTKITTYLVFDGELVWSYSVMRDKEHYSPYCYVDYYDAKEFLPEYQKIFKEVEAQVAKEMKANGSWNTFGSCHSFWARKKALLAKRGILWLSPPDLHPGTCYD